MKAPAPNRWIFFAIWAVPWVEPLAAATVIAAEDDGPVASDDISENLSRTENEEAVGGLVRYFREARRRLREKAALDTSLSYHTLGMGAVGGGGVPTAMSGDLTLQGVWKPGARWQPRPGLRITPDVQLVVGNGFNSSPGVRFVFGLRAGLEF
ncbi:MAG: hypothetical protein OSA84_10855 [Akkermansiaceae bacterium]|nr:hypothetical protein [Akkermansiaceae bacterium]